MKKGNAPITLGTQDIGELLLQYSLPAVVAMIAASLYNITDSIFIGRGVGDLAFSGLTISFPIMNLAAAFGSLVGVGAAALLSLRLGQKDYESANKILGNVIVLNTVSGLIFSITIFLFLKPLLIFFGASENVLPYAYDFMTIILIGNVITHIYMGLNALLRSMGLPKESMFMTIYAVLINIVLNPIFIFVLKLGIRGSALATVISQTIVLLIQIKFFVSQESFIHFQKGIYKLKKEIVKGIISIGLAPFLLNSVSCIIVIVINKQLSSCGGDMAVGAYGIVNRVMFLFVMIVLGINQGMQPIAGYNYGAKLYQRVSEVLRKTMICAVSVMCFGFVLVELFPHLVGAIFTDSKELINLAATGLRYVFMCSLLIGFQMVTTTFFQSIGQAYKSIFLSLTRQAIFLIPMLVILPKYFGITGVWVSFPIADFTAAIVSCVLLSNQIKKFKVLKLQDYKQEVA